MEAVLLMYGVSLLGSVSVISFLFLFAINHASAFLERRRALEAQLF